MKDNKIFIVIVLVIILGSVGVALSTTTPKKPRLGTEQADQGRKHIPLTQKEVYKSQIPTSGPHTEEATWGVSPTQLPNERVIHNMEHGGIVVSYRPDLDKATITKLERLYAAPYAVAKFSPTKAVVMPREGQKKAIVLASWNRLLELDKYNQQTLIDYYLTNIGKSPEPGAS